MVQAGYVTCVAVSFYLLIAVFLSLRKACDSLRGKIISPAGCSTRVQHVAACAALLWPLAGRGTWPILFTLLQCLSPLCIAKQGNSKFLESTWQQQPPVILGSVHPCSLGNLSPTSL